MDFLDVVIFAACIAFTMLVQRISRLQRHLPNIFMPPQLPIFGNFLDLLANTERIHDWRYEHALQAQVVEAEILQRTNPFVSSVEVLSPRMLKYMLHDNFDNFEKGPRARGIFQDLLGNGIFNSDGEEWRSTRKTASHMFSASKLNNFMLESFIKHAETLSTVLNQQVAKQERAKAGPSYIDMQTVFLQFTLDAICEIGYGVELNSLSRKESDQPAFAKAFDLVQEATVWRFLGPELKYKIQRLLNIQTEATMAAQMPVVNEFIYTIIRTRKENAKAYKDNGDLLSLFLAEKTDLSDTELRDLVLNFLIAGRDTTAALLTWFFYEVSQRPALRLQLVEEIESVFGQVQAGEAATRGIEHVSLKEAVFLEAVLLETLRLHPPIPTECKRAIAACTFPDGSQVPAGTLVNWSPYTMGRLRTIWGSDALEFKPERWLTEPDANGVRSLVQKSQYAFPVFNAGFRSCLGRSMALMEAKTVAATLLRKHRLETKPTHDPHYRINVVLFMKHGLPMQVHHRED